MFTLLHKGVKYFNRKVVEHYRDYGFKVVREESRNLVFNDLRYSLISKDNKTLAFIRGYPKSKDHFYIERVERLAEDKKGMLYARLIRESMVKDLRAIGYKYATSLATLKLAPILVRKLGATVFRNINLKKFRKGWRRRIPWKMILMRYD